MIVTKQGEFKYSIIDTLRYLFRWTVNEDIYNDFTFLTFEFC